MKTMFVMCLLTLVSSEVFADWKQLGPLSGPMVELDMGRSQKLKRNYLAYARTTRNDQQLEFKTEIDCARKRHKMLYQHVRNSWGLTVYKSKEIKPWESIQPGTVFDALMVELCKVK